MVRLRRAFGARGHVDRPRISLLALPRVVRARDVSALPSVLCDAIGIVGGGFVASSQLHASWHLYLDTAKDALQTPGSSSSLPKDRLFRSR